MAVASCSQHTEDIKSHREQAPMSPLRSCMQHLQGEIGSSMEHEKERPAGSAAMEETTGGESDRPSEV